MTPKEHAAHIVGTIGADNLRYRNKGLQLKEIGAWTRIYPSDIKELLDSLDEKPIDRVFVHAVIESIRKMLPKGRKFEFELMPFKDKVRVKGVWQELEVPAKEYVARHLWNRKAFLREVVRQARRRADAKALARCTSGVEMIAYINTSGECEIAGVGRVYAERPAEKYTYLIRLIGAKKAEIFCVGEELEALAGWCADALFAAARGDPPPSSPVRLEESFYWDGQLRTEATRKTLTTSSI
jgi:hypothetical protein